MKGGWSHRKQACLYSVVTFWPFPGPVFDFSRGDRAGVVVLDVTRYLTREYDQMLLTLHKNDASDAHVMVLFDDYAAVKPEINAAPGSLKFK